MIINNNKINIKKKINKISIGYFMNIIDIEKRKEEFIKYLTTFKNVINIYHVESLSLLYPEKILGFRYIEALLEVLNEKKN